jgi:serine/threonine protein kinase
MIGSKINQYLIQEKIGAGGQGTVYKALDTKLNRTVVIKVLPPELTAKTANFKRFEREAQLCSQLDHPNICTIYDFHEANGIYYIAMQYVEGKNVRQLVAGRPLELEKARFRSPCRFATDSPTRIRAALFTAILKPETLWSTMRGK